ncbi:hypothetical protein ACEPAF_1589 [Sanghuangporus sanghuang]
MISGLGNPQTSIPQAVAGMQPVAVAPMVPASTGDRQGTTMGMSGGLAGGTIGTGGPAAASGGSAEMAAGGPVGPDAAAAPGPSGPAGPSGETIVQYFKSGYNSAAAGANANNNRPAAIAAPSSRGAVPPV